MDNGGYQPPAYDVGYPITPSSIPPPAAGSRQTVTVVVARKPAEKSLVESYLLWFPLGILGFHHFYLRRYGFGCLYLFTLGLCGVGWLVDGFRMSCLVRDANRRIENGPDHQDELSVVDAYLLWFPLGLIGLHHYYLRRPAWGVAYTLTLGLLGIGWIIDAFRLPSLVTDANERLALQHARSHEPRQVRLTDVYVLGLTPAGLVGAHHFYLHRVGFGMYYLLTLGGCGVGWIVDWFRMPWLVERANNPEKHPLGNRHKFVDDAYVLAFPFGFLGLHHFYLERPGWGTLYLFTLGLGGIGWLCDLCRMPCLVADTNERLAHEASVMHEVRTQLGVNPGGAYVVTTPREVVVYPPALGYQQGPLNSSTNGPTVNGAGGATAPEHHLPPPPYAEKPNQLPPGYSQYGSVDDVIKPM
jgi:TM2 domain-containing membrane protein YozV